MVQVIRVLLDAHVAKEPSWQEKRRILHGTLLALSGEAEPRGVGKYVSTEIAVLLFLNYECVLKGLVVADVDLAAEHDSFLQARFLRVVGYRHR